ncbi:phosphoribosyl-ATP pyrophosphatase [Gibbsiella quercinecans]|nr:phosphoribosyl-ATP pyrophosphatase [Gibbsiella quercinecans]
MPHVRPLSHWERAGVRGFTTTPSHMAKIQRLRRKLGKEGVETALAATVHDREELTNEASDLIYHLLVLLQDQDLDLSKVIGCLRARHQK